VASKAAVAGNGPVGSLDADQVSDSVMWRGYDLQRIIDARYGDKLPCAADSNRHTESLKLATDLLLMLDGDKGLVQRIVEAQPWVKEIIEERDENVEQTVSSAADCVAQKERKYASSLPSKAMLAAIQEATGKTFVEITKAQAQTATLKDDDMARWLWDWGARIEALMGDFPLLRDVCKGLKRNQYPAALFVGGGLLMTLMTRCTYRFYHRPEELRRLNNSTLIIGDPASGKSFAVRLDRLILAPIKRQSEEASKAINKYKREAQERGTSSKAQEQDALKKPKLINRYMPARTANGVFIESMTTAKENVNGEDMNLHMVTFDSELDNSTKMQKGGGWIDKQSMELKAFHNEEDGQNYANVNSYNGVFDVFWNFVYTGTPDALNAKVNARNFGTGLATRLATIPMPEPSFDLNMMMASADDYTQADIVLSEWANKLDQRYGELPLAPLSDCTKEWTEGRMKIAEFNNKDKADLMLIKRVGYYGMNIPAPFIDMRHWDEREQTGSYQVDDVDISFCRLVLEIQYRCQHFFYGAMAYNYYDNQARDRSANTTCHTTRFAQCFKMLPEKFSRKDFAETFGIANSESCGKQIDGLIREGKIIRLKRDNYEKKVANL
jgi:hypothetical protein